MANSFTNKYKKRQPAAGDLNWDDEINQNQTIDDVIGAARDLNNRVIYGLAATDGGALVVSFAAGRVEVGGSIFEIAASTKTAVDDTSARSVNYLYVDSSGVVQINQTAPTGVYAPIAIVDVSSGGIDRIGDFRQQSSGLLADETLAEINKIIDTTTDIADVFLYDTSKDSDGGAWRERTEHTSWYNETLDTATRGGTRKFPAIAFIVAETDKITIYDATDVSLPMWKGFEPTALTGFEDWWRGGRLVSSVTMLNGIMVFGVNVIATSGGVSIANFPGDYGQRISTNTNTAGKVSPLTSITTIELDLSNTESIIDSLINSVAITVLPGAPIDLTTGLPAPTIAAATDGGISVITDVGEVWDITNSGTNKEVSKVRFNDKNEILWTSQDDAFSNVRGFFILPIPASDINGAPGYIDLLNVRFYNNQTHTTIPTLTTSAWNNFVSEFLGGTFYALGHTGHLSLLKEDPATPANSMVNYISKDFQSGWLHGDIKGAWLADTDNTNLVGVEEVTDGDFPSNTNWTEGTGWLIGSGVAAATAVTTSDYLTSDVAISMTAGEVLVLSGEITAYTSGSMALGFTTVTGTFTSTAITGSAAVGPMTPRTITCTTTGTLKVRMEPLSTSTLSVDNFSARLAVPDRSLNGNGLQIFGTIVKTAVATGAELIGYSGFDTNIFLEQPYNADLDFGTGDFYIMGWAETTTDATNDYLFNREDPASAGAVLRMFFNTSNELSVSITGSSLIISNVIPDDNWFFVTLVRRSGVIYLFINEESVDSTASTSDLDNTDATLQFGRSRAGQFLTNGSMALWRTGAGAPTDEQIKHIYETEKHLFKENADCTFSGTSDAVAALAKDEVNDLLYVGTGDGVSVFSGLQRIDYIDTTGIPTSDVVNSLSASSGAYIIGNAAEAVGYIPAANLREEIVRQEQSGEVLELTWFTGDTTETDFTMPNGWKPKFVYEAGLLVKEGSSEEYTVTFDGFLYTVVFASAPAVVDIGVMGVKS